MGTRVEPVEFLQGRPAGRTNPIRHANHAAHPLAILHQHRGLSPAFQRPYRVAQGRRMWVLRVEEGMAAYRHGLAVDLAPDALSGQAGDLTGGGIAVQQRLGLRCRHDRPRQGMFGAAFDGGGQGQQVVAGRAGLAVRKGAVDRLDMGQGGLAFGQRAGLVEGEGLDMRQRLQRRAALDQHAQPGRLGESADDRDGVLITSAHGQAMISRARAR